MSSFSDDSINKLIEQQSKLIEELSKERERKEYATVNTVSYVRGKRDISEGCSKKAKVFYKAIQNENVRTKLQEYYSTDSLVNICS
jgi:hypothetical protein